MTAGVPSLAEAFRKRLAGHPDSPAFMITSGDRYLQIPWRQFMRDVDAMAWAIRHYYGKDAVIALLGENSYEWMTCHAACIFCGATVVPLDTSASPAELAMRISFTGTKLVVFSAQNRQKARDTMRLTSGTGVAFVGFGSVMADNVVMAGHKALREGAPSVFDSDRDQNETATIVFTSGTTSKPRGVELSLANMSAFPASAARVLPVEPGWRSLMVLPLHHIFGIETTYFLLANGVALGVCPDFRRLHDSVRRFRADCLFLVPALAEILAQKETFRRRSCEQACDGREEFNDEGDISLKWILTGGAPLMRRTFENLQALGIRVLEGYGLTETASLFSLAPFDDPRPGTAGLASPLCETRVSPDGELLIRGPSVFKGYFRDPESTSRVLSKDGWFSTGDNGSISQDGYVTVSSRRNRSIILSSGKKVAPEELEYMLGAMPGVLESIVTGEGESRIITAEIYTLAPKAAIERQISALNTMLPIYKRIRNVVIRNEPFPRTASGKIIPDRG